MFQGLASFWVSGFLRLLSVAGDVNCNRSHCYARTAGGNTTGAATGGGGLGFRGVGRGWDDPVGFFKAGVRSECGMPGL